jgi:phosphatidylglycerol lysyltransferase
MTRRSPLVSITAAATFGSGLINLYSLIGRALPRRVGLLRSIFPLEFLHISRFLMLVVGFALVVSALNVYRRKERAFYVVVALSALSIVFHLTKGIDYEEAFFSVVLLLLLFAAREQFTVRSRRPEWRTAFELISIIALVAVAYGAVGFALLDGRDFGAAPDAREAVVRAVKVLSLGDASVVPRTRHAVWFLDSLQLMTAMTVLFSTYALFKPALHQLQTVPQERQAAARILDRHGHAALDFFKIWPDKSLFFSRSGEAFLAYGVAGGFAVVLGDPVGPSEEVEAIVPQFAAWCADNDWRVAFYQTAPTFLVSYARAGFKRLKIGDEAVVDLERFNLEGRDRKPLRSAVRKLEAAGVRTEWHDPPLEEAVLDRMQTVSDEWLRLPGRRERRFAVGRFTRDYVRGTPVFAAIDVNGRMLAFVNVVRSYREGESTIDLMRRGASAPNGIMDYLFVKLFLLNRAAGFERFNLGMAPMAGFDEHETASPEERAVHAFFQQLNFVFDYKGLKAYKAKFASAWEPRYVCYRHVLDLPRVALALARLSESRGSA